MDKRMSSLSVPARIPQQEHVIDTFCGSPDGRVLPHRDLTNGFQIPSDQMDNGKLRSAEAMGMTVDFGFESCRSDLVGCTVRAALFARRIDRGGNG